MLASALVKKQLSFFYPGKQTIKMFTMSWLWVEPILHLHIHSMVNLQTVLKQERVGVSEGTLYLR